MKKIFITIIFSLLSLQAEASPLFDTPDAKPYEEIRKFTDTLDGVEYGGYVLYRNCILDADGNVAGCFVISPFSMERFRNQGKNQKEGSDGTRETSRGSGYPTPPDVWWMASRAENTNGFLYILIDAGTDAAGRKDEVTASVYYRGARIVFKELGGESTRDGILPGRETPEGRKRPSNAECRELAVLLLRALAGEDVRLQYNQPELEKREKLYLQAEEKARFSNQNWLNHEWQWSGYYGNPSKTMKAMGVAPLVKPGRVPNVNYRAQGFKELRKQLETLIAKQSGTVVHMHKGIDNGEIVEWDFCLGDKSRVHVSMANAYSITQAMKMMYTYPERFFDDNFGGLSREIGLDHKYNCEQLPDMLEFAEGVAGEHAIRMRHVISDEGLPVKGSEKRSIYFTRGNTAVGVFTDNPAFNVLPIARAIDKLLVEGMRKAGEPLTREQDYLKEGKKQK